LTEFLENFFLYTNKNPLKNKIVIGTPTKHIHYTVHLGGNSGYVDIHITDERLDESSGKYQTLFKMKKEDMFNIIESMSQHLPALIMTLLPQKISLSVLNRNGWYLQSLHKSAKESEGLVKLKKKGFKFDKNFKIRNLSNSYIMSNEIHENEDFIFLAYDKKNKFKGVLIKEAKLGTIFFIKKQKYYLFLKNCLNIIKEIINSKNIEEKDTILKFISKIGQDLDSEFF